MRTEWKFGAHQAHFEEPDTLWIRFSGPTTFEEARRTVELCQEVGSVRPFFLVLDVADSTISPESRDYIVKNIKQEWFQAIIYVGLGMVQRAMAKALVVALYFSRWKVHIEFLAGEQEARSLIRQRRAKPDHRAA